MIADITAMSEHLNIVLCSLEAWDDVWRRNQLLVDEILKARPQTKVLFVEPPVDLLHSARRREIPRQVGVRRIQPNVWALRPLKLWPRLLAGNHVDVALGRQVINATRSLDMHQFVLWINDTSYASFAVSIEQPVIYDITDDWLQASGTPRTIQRRRYEHAAMMGRAEQVSVVSESLLLKGRRTRDVVRVPDAVDLSHFQREQERPTDLPPGDYVIYVGTLHSDRIDVDLCADVARTISPVPFLLLGPDCLEERDRRKLSEAGCRLLGARPYSRIPGYYQHASVIAVPHVVTPFTESLDPIKLYECLAVGRPTVTTPVSGMRDAGSPIVAVEREIFSARVSATLAEHSSSHPRDAPSWTERAAEMLALIDAARMADPSRPPV